MTNKFFSSVDGIRIRVASVMHRCCHRSDSVSFMSGQSLLPILLLCLTLFIGAGQMWGADTTTEYTFSSKSWAASPANWTGSKDGNQFNTSGTPKGVQVCTGQSGVTVTSPKSFTNVTKVEVTYSSSSKGVGSIGIKIGDNTALTAKSISKSQTETVLTFTPSSGQNGSVVMTCTVTTNSMGINKIKIYETPVASKTLSSIAITTQPNTRKYLVGDSFSKTGAVVRATYSDNSTADVSSSATWTPSGALTAGTSKTMTASYTESSTTKTATTTVDVYSVTVQKQDETGATITADGVTASVSGRTLSASATAASKYVFKGWKFGTASGTSIASTGSANTTLNGTPTGNVTVIAEFYKPIPVSWNKNGSLHATTYTGYNQKPVFPANPSSCDATSNTFYGWATGTWDDPVDNLTGKTVYTSASSMPDVTGTVTYHAVFAKVVAGSDYELITDLANLKAGDAYLGSYINYSGWRYYAATSNSAMTNVSTSGTPLKLSSTTGLQKVTFVETATSGQFQIKNSNNKYLYANGTGSAPSWSDTECAWIFSNKDANNLFKVKSSLGTYYLRAYATSTTVGALKMYGSETNSGLCVFQASTSYSKYLTTCCTELVSINGSFNRYHFRYHLKIFHHIIMSMFISLIFKC